MVVRLRKVLAILRSGKCASVLNWYYLPTYLPTHPPTNLPTVEPNHNSHLLDRKVAVVETFKQESMYGLSAKKVAIVERWPLVEVQLYSPTDLPTYPPTHLSTHLPTHPSTYSSTYLPTYLTLWQCRLFARCVWCLLVAVDISNTGNVLRGQTDKSFQN